METKTGENIRKHNKRNKQDKKRKTEYTFECAAEFNEVQANHQRPSVEVSKRQRINGNDVVSMKDQNIKKSSELIVKNRVKKSPSQWNFTVDYNDHFETPSIAYSDVYPLLNCLSTLYEKTNEELAIYDPYWCEGSMVQHLKNLGFGTVINRNRDFYADIKRKLVPGFDVLVTNPPYSGEHKVNLLKFLSTHHRTPSVKSSQAIVDSVDANTNASQHIATADLPFALLLPVYVASKSYWKEFSQQQATVGKKVFYILPPNYYEYSHPEGTGKDIPPFYSAWFVGGLRAQDRDRAIAAIREYSRKVVAGPKDAVAPVPTAATKKLSFSSLLVAESIETLVQRGLVTEMKRPNPKQRQKMRAKCK